MYDVAIIGAGIAGMATAARLQARYSRPSCWSRTGSRAGVPASSAVRVSHSTWVLTTLVDFEAGGVGGELLESIGMPPLDGDQLPGYVAWLPDRVVTLHRAAERWSRERLRAFGGDTPAHQGFWRLLDQLARVFWHASRVGVKLPIESSLDAVRALGGRWDFITYTSLAM